MSDRTLDIESVVREVIRRLSNGAAPTAAGETSAVDRGAVDRVAGAARADNSGSNGSDSGTIVLSDRVISLAQIAGRLDHAQRLIVPAQSVLTPSVCDELRKHQITVQRGCERTATAVDDRSRWRILAGHHAIEVDLLGLLAGGAADGFDVEWVAATGLPALLQKIAWRFAAPRVLGVIVCRAPHDVACQANRNTVFRAAAVSAAEEAVAARRTFAANLLVVSHTNAKHLQRIVSSAVGVDDAKN